MKKYARLLWLVLWLTVVAAAQTVTVKRNVNLRPDPSTDGDPIVTLTAGDQLTLVETDATNGFLHVKTSDGQAGWVWGRNVKVGPRSSTAGASETPGGEIASEISPDWERPDPQGSVFHGSEGDCPEIGSGTTFDADTNRRKNRIDIPSTYHPVTWDAVNTAKFPQGAPKNRGNWTPEQLAAIKNIEGAAVTVEGFLTKVKVEKSSPNSTKGGESTNCHFHLADDVDWHMPLTAQAGQGEDVAIVVETTPRIRADHPNWTTANLQPWTATGKKVRISGWLMLDPEHQDMIDHGQRSTLWEIHPVTKIEVMKNGQFVDLDSQ
jgi:uncharacterized protein YgiM (DUF1202 family)